MGRNQAWTGRNRASLALLVSLVAACEGGGAPAPPGLSAPTPPVTEAAPVRPAEPPASLSVLGEAGRGSPIVAAALARRHPLASDPHGRVLIVADEEGDAVRVLDATSGAVLSETAMSGGPTAALVVKEDRILIALRRASAAVMLSVSEDLGLHEIARAPTAEEPVALALAREPAQALVASGFGHTLAGFSLDRLEKTFSMDLPREPRAIAVAGSRVLISHMVGSTVSDIDLRATPPQRTAISMAGNDISVVCDCMGDFSGFIARASGQGFGLAVSEGRLWVPTAFSRPRTADSSSGYGSGTGAFAAIDAGLAAIELDTRKLSYRVEDTVFNGQKLRQRFEHHPLPPPTTPPGRCLLPRAALAVPSKKHLLVACLGSDEVVEIDTENKPFVTSFTRSFHVPSGPVGLAVDEARGEAFVWSAFDRAVSVLFMNNKYSDADGRAAGLAQAAAPARSFALPALPGQDPRAALGRRLFHATFDKRVSRDGRACASCHPDGRDDGLVWSSPKGPLQTPMLAGRLADTAPYGWMGDASTVGAHLHDTFVRLGGKGLTGADLEALVAYVTGLPGPTRPAPADARVARGKEIFESVDTMCTICHTQGGKGTDGARHDVGSGVAMETPTLRFVAGTAPYFHDGRYATLRDLLKGSSGKMGGSLDGLGEPDLDALEAYLRTL